MSARRQRCVGYCEFRDMEMEIKVPKGEVGCNRGVQHDRIRRRDMGYGDNKWRKMDGEIKVRGGVVESSRSDSGGSDGVGLWKRRVVDRELGELSSDSGSDCDIVLDSQVKDNDKEVSSSMMKGRDSLELFNVTVDYGKGISPRPSKTAKIQLPESTKSSVEHDSCVSTCGSSLTDQTLDAEAQRVYYDMKAGSAEDDDFVTLRNIRSSRWANDFDSPADEGEIFEDEVMPKLGELKQKGSSGVGSKSFDSEERVWSSGRDSCSGHVTDNNVMEEDEDRHYDSGCASQSDSELEDATKLCSSLRRNVNMLHGCRSVDEFERLNKINEGTYGVVYRARDKKTGEIVALKKVKMEKEREGFPLTALREINILLSFDHSSIVDVKEIVVGSSFDDIFMVMEYMEHDLKGFLETRKQGLSESEVKSLMLQLLKGTKYLHDNWVLHRDLKTSNLLLNDEFELKICDFGLARQYGSPLKPYTQLVVTLWYRAPELLLGAKQYSTAIDMWSIGCIMAELLSKGPLFNGKSELDQIDKIFRTLGAPNDSIWPGYSKHPGAKGIFVKHKNNMLRKKFPPSSFSGAPVLSDAGFDLLSKLLTYDPERRISAELALEHDWFKEIPCSADKALPHRSMQRITKGPDTLEGKQWRELQRWGSSSGGVFG